MVRRGLWQLDLCGSDDVCALRCIYRRRNVSEQAFDESQGLAPIAAFFCIADSAVVVVDGLGPSAVSWWQVVFGFAVVVRGRHHVGVDVVVSEAKDSLVMVNVLPGRSSEEF